MICVIHRTGHEIAMQQEPIVNDWPEDVRRFLDSVEWTFAKTYADTWPHHYIVKERVDEALFLKTALHIRDKGVPKNFYRREILYFEQDEFVYWTMVPPVADDRWYPPERETIINKCRAEDTYECRLKYGTLPE